MSGFWKVFGAIGLGGHPDPRVMRIDNIPGEDVGGPEFLVVHGLHAEIDLGHPRRFDDVQPHLVLEDPDGTGGFGLPQDHVVVVLHGFNIGQGRQNGLAASAVACVVVDLEAAHRDLEVRAHEILVHRHHGPAARCAQLLAAIETAMVQPGVLVRDFLAQLPPGLVHRHRAMRPERPQETGCSRL